MLTGYMPTLCLSSTLGKWVVDHNIKGSRYSDHATLHIHFLQLPIYLTNDELQETHTFNKTNLL